MVQVQFTRFTSIRADYNASEDDQILVRGVAENEGALGFFGYAYVVENVGRLKAVPIKPNAAAPAVAPSFETVKSGTYQPLSRPLFIYVRKAITNRAAVQAFVNFYLSPSFTPYIQSSKIGYVTLDPNIYEAVSRRFKEQITGTLFPKGTEIGATLERYLK